MPHTAATSAASSMSATTARFTRAAWLALLLLYCLVSLCTNAVQGSPLVPRAEQQDVADYQRMVKPLKEPNSADEREQRRRVACRRACWAKFVPENADCLKDTICYQCYLNCASPLISPTTTTTTTTTVPTTMSIMERHQQQQQQQLQQTQQASKINKPIQETWTLHTVSMLQQDSLVLVDIAWDALNTPNQCLISWEVSGGGLMGNLLTESSTVQLSLWPDTKYRVKVTCKNKLTGFMSRSLPLSIDTSEAVNAHDHTGQHKTQSPNAEVTSISTTTMGSKIFTPYRYEQQQQQLEQHINNNALEHINSGNNDEDTDISSHSNGYLADVDNAAVLPYDEHDNEEDQSAEALNKHTKFIFNWHTENSDISLIEPIHKPDLNMLQLAVDDIQKPFLFGLTAGTIMLGLVALALRCMLRRRRLALEKTLLITDDTIHAVVSVAPAEVAMRFANNKAAARKAAEGARGGCGGGGAGVTVGALGATSLAYQRSSSDEEGEDRERQRERDVDEVCSNPAICSRNALKV